MISSVKKYISRRLQRNSLGFTLIELLVVIAIIAILAVVVVLVLNPVSLLQQARDSNRLSDLQTITSAMNIYNTDQGGTSAYTLGIPGVTYLSVPDPTATTTAGTNCAGLGLSGDYHCAASSTYRAVNGTGWLPVDLAAITSASPLSVLPVDPINTTSTGLCYAYATDGKNWEIAASPESQKYSANVTNFTMGTTNTLLSGGCAPVVYTTSTLTLSGNMTGYQDFLQFVFDPHTNTVWASNDVSGPGVYQINSVTYATVPITIPVYAQYNIDMAFDPHTNTIWLVDNNSSTVTVINDTTFATTTVPVGKYPIGIAFDSHTNTMWVMNELGNTVTMIDDTSFATTTLPIPTGPIGGYGIDFDPHTNTMWLPIGNHILIFNDTTFATSTIPLGSSNTGGYQAFDPHTNTMWEIMQGQSIAVINDTTNAVDTIPFPEGDANGDGCLVFDPHTNSMWACELVSKGLLQINDTTYVGTAYSTSEFYYSLVFDPYTNAIWADPDSASYYGDILTPSR